MTKQPLKAVIFDVDGTLAETEESHRQAFNAAFEAFGYDWVWSQAMYKDLLKVAGGKERIRLYLSQHHPEMLERDDIDAHIPEIHKRKTGFYEQLLNDGAVELRPGVVRLLAELKAEDVTLAVATTTHQANLKALLLNTLGPEGECWFAAMGCGEQAPNKKPAPDVYNYVLSELDLPPEACLAIEDAEIGLKAALNAGIPTLVTVSPYTSGGTFEGASTILSDLGEPDAPFEVIEGGGFGGTHVTPSLLRKWHSLS